MDSIYTNNTMQRYTQRQYLIDHRGYQDSSRILQLVYSLFFQLKELTFEIQFLTPCLILLKLE